MSGDSQQADNGGESGNAGSTGLSRPDLGTVAGVVAFVGGGLSTVLAAVTDFGSEDGALAAARRNHADALVVAALLAAFGMFLGAVYAIVRGEHSNRWKRWTAAALLVGGVACVLGGVVVGIAATSDRTPGRPAIEVDASGESTVKVTVTGDGFASDDQFELVAHGFELDDAGKVVDGTFVQVARGRFSPNQAGLLNWSIHVPKTPGLEAITVIVDTGDSARECNVAPDPDGSRAEDAPTCLYVMLDREGGSESPGSS